MRPSGSWGNSGSLTRAAMRSGSFPAALQADIKPHQTVFQRAADHQHEEQHHPCGVHPLRQRKAGLVFIHISLREHGEHTSEQPDIQPNEQQHKRHQIQHLYPHAAAPVLKDARFAVPLDFLAHLRSKIEKHGFPPAGHAAIHLSGCRVPGLLRPG